GIYRSEKERAAEEEERGKGKVARPMVDLAESRAGSIHHLIFQYLGLISQILKRFSGLQMQISKVQL
ncbi:MAG: hypothetical protein ACWGNI_07540, partial [Desulfobacterales bacterium]